MRQQTINSVSYVPELPPENDVLSRYIYTELQRISAAIDALALGRIEKTYVAPAKPRDGDLRYADGTSWNPGSGAGIYYYNGSAWSKL